MVYDPLARPGQATSPNSLPLSTPSSQLGDISQPTSTTLPGTAGINLATGSVRLFGLENQPTQSNPVTAAADFLNLTPMTPEENTYKIAEPWRSGLSAVGGFLTQAAGQQYGGAVPGQKELASNQIIASQAGELLPSAIESVGQFVGQVPVLSNVVGAAGNPIGAFGDVVGAVGGATLGAIQHVVSEIIDKPLVAGPRVDQAIKVADLATGNNIAYRRAEYDRLHGSPFPWDWKTPEYQLGWQDYLDWAKASYDTIGTEKPFNFNDPISVLGGAGSFIGAINQLNTGDAKTVQSNLAYLSRDFIDLYNQGVDPSEILTHLEDSGKLTNSDPINALVFSLNPITFKAWDIPFLALGRAAKTTMAAGTVIGRAAKGTVNNEAFVARMAELQLSKPVFEVAKRTRSIGLMWNAAADRIGPAKAAIQFWSPTTFQAATETFGSMPGGVAPRAADSGAVFVQGYYDMHKAISEDAALNFQEGFLRTLQYQITGETYAQWGNEATINALSNTKQVLQIAASGDFKALSTHPMLAGQSQKIIDELVNVVQAYRNNPGGEAETKAVEDFFKKLAIAKTKAEIRKNVGGVVSTSSQIKYLFKVFKDKILASSRIKMEESMQRFFVSASQHLHDGLGASGQLFENAVANNLAAAGVSGSAEAEIIVRSRLAEIFNGIQKSFNESVGKNAPNRAAMVRELAKHLEVARMAAYGRAQEYGTELSRIIPDVNIISQRSLTLKKLDESVRLLEEAIQSGSPESISSETLRIVRGYDQVGSRIDGSIVFEELLKETPELIAKKVIGILNEIRREKAYVSENSKLINNLELIINGPESAINVSPKAVSVWDASIISSTHAAFDGEVDATNIAEGLFKSPEDLIMVANRASLDKSTFKGDLENAFELITDGFKTGGYDRVRSLYENLHSGVIHILEGIQPDVQPAVHAAGLRPIKNGSGIVSEIETADKILNGAFGSPKDFTLAKYNEADVLEQVSIDGIDSSWINAFANWHTPGSQIGRDFSAIHDGLIITDGGNNKHLVLTWTDNGSGLHAALVRNRIARQVEASLGSDSAWGTGKIEINVANRYATPNEAFAGSELDGVDWENVFSHEELPFHKFTNNTTYGYMDKTQISFGQIYLSGYKGGSVAPNRAIVGTAKNLETLDLNALKVLFLDPGAVISKYLTRADQWVDRGFGFDKTILVFNKDEFLIKVHQLMSPDHQLKFGAEIDIDPNVNFWDWLRDHYLSQPVDNTGMTIFQMIRKAYGPEFDSHIAEFMQSYPDVAKGSVEIGLFKMLLSQDAGLANVWVESPRRILANKKIIPFSGNPSGKLGATQFTEKTGGMHNSWADWLHAWDSREFALYTSIVEGGIKSTGNSLFDLFGIDGYTSALWRRAFEIVDDKIKPGMELAEGKTVEDIRSWMRTNHITSSSDLENMKNAEDVVGFIRNFKDFFKHPYLPSEDLSGLEPLRAHLHDQAEQLGTLADRNVINLADAINPAYGGTFGDGSSPLWASFSGNGETLIQHAPMFSIDPHAGLVANGKQAGALGPEGYYTLSPRIYAENGTPLPVPKWVNMREIKKPKRFFNAGNVKVQYPYDFGNRQSLDLAAIINSFDNIAYSNAAAAASSAAASQDLYDKLTKDKSMTKAADLYKSIKELGYSIGRAPEEGLMYRTHYIPSVIDHSIVPIALPRPYMPINTLIPREALGIAGEDIIQSSARSMNLMKRAMVNWSNGEQYTSFVQRLWLGARGSLSEDEAYSITAHLFRRAITQEVNPQGLTADEVANIFITGMGGGEWARRKYYKIFGGFSGNASPRSLLLYAAAGDLGKIGLAPHISKSTQARFPALATWVNKMYPNMRYRYNPFFNQQEAVEPIALLELNGIRGKKIKEEASLLAGLLSAPGTARWDNWETGSQILRAQEATLADIAKNAEGIDLWGQIRSNSVVGQISTIFAPIGDAARAKIAAIKASAIQQMALNNAKVRGGLNRVLDAMPGAKRYLAEKGLTNSESAFKYVVDAARMLAIPSQIIPWAESLAAKWTYGAVMDLAPLESIKEIVTRLNGGGTMTATEIETLISAKLLAERTGATDGVQKQFVQALEDLISNIKQKNVNEVKTVTGKWENEAAMSTADGISGETSDALAGYSMTKFEAINNYLAAKAEFGVQETALAQDTAKMAKYAERIKKYSAGSPNPFEQMDKLIALIDKAINRNVITQNYPLYRGFSQEDILSSVRINNLKVGDEIGLENFNSFTRNEVVAHSFSRNKPSGAVWRILNPRGIPGVDLLAGRASSMHSGEAEVLLPRGLKWRVLGVDEMSPETFPNVSGKRVPMYTISPILDRNFRVNLSGPAAELAHVQGVQQSLDAMFVEYSQRAETVRNSYKLFELYPVIKKKLADRGMALNVTYENTSKVNDIITRAPRTWTQSFQGVDPTTNQLVRNRVMFSTEPGPAIEEANVVFGKQLQFQGGGMNQGGKTGKWEGLDGKIRYVKKVGLNAANKSDRYLSAINEWVAQMVYRKLGYHVPKTSMLWDGTDIYLTSEWVSDSFHKTLDQWTQEEAAKLMDGVLVDQLFGSLDVTGRMEAANTLVDNAMLDNLGNAWRIDLGSFGLFRAGGGRKHDVLNSFDPAFWWKNAGKQGSKYGVKALLERAFPNATFVSSKTKVITDAPTFMEMAQELITQLDTIHPQGIRGFLNDLYYEGYRAIGKETGLAESEIAALSKETADAIESQLIGLRETLDIEQKSLAARIEAYQSYQAAQSSGVGTIKMPDLSYEPDSVVEDLLKRMAYHHQNGSMLPLWEESLAKVSRNEPLTSQEIIALGEYVPEFLYKRADYEQVYRAMALSLMEGTQRAVVRQLYPTEKTWLERSLNHPYLGIYPLSYMIHKVLPEFLDVLFKYAPFTGQYKPLYGAYALGSINDHIAAALEQHPEVQKFVESRPPLILWLNGILPGFPTDVSVSLPYWLRSGILGPVSRGKPEEIIPSLERAGLTSLTRTVGPLQSATQLINIQNDIWDFIFGPNGNPLEGIDQAIQSVLYPQGSNGGQEDIINRPN